MYNLLYEGNIGLCMSLQCWAMPVTFGSMHHIATRGYVRHIATFGNVCHIVLLGITTSHCDIRFYASHSNKGLCSSHCDVWKCLSHCDVKICTYITPWCYGSSYSYDEPMCISLRRHNVRCIVTKERVL